MAHRAPHCGTHARFSLENCTNQICASYRTIRRNAYRNVFDQARTHMARLFRKPSVDENPIPSQTSSYLSCRCLQILKWDRPMRIDFVRRENPVVYELAVAQSIFGIKCRNTKNIKSGLIRRELQPSPMASLQPGQIP